MQALGDVLHEGVGRGSGSSKMLKFLEEFLMHRQHCFGLVLTFRRFRGAQFRRRRFQASACKT
jgi:hypothetical protein